MDCRKAQRVRRSGSILIPEGGVSAADAQANHFTTRKRIRLVHALSDNLRQTHDRRLIRLPLHINDAAFSNALVQNFLDIAA
jgi:uncharacterized protein (UPF0261 family)